jgi:DNA primase
MSVIDEVKQKLDILEIVGQYTTLTKSGRTYRAPCPFHTEKNPSFYVYPEQQSWHCFGACNTGGDVFSFIMKKENIDFGEALRILAERAGVTLPTRYQPDTDREEKDKIFRVNEAAALYYHNLLLNSREAEKAREYLQKRGLSRETIANFQLGYCLNSWEALKEYLLEKEYTTEEMLEVGLIIAAEDGRTHDRFRNRLIFPIRDNRGRVTGFGARVLDDSLPKYMNSPQSPVFDKSGTLYGINLAAPAIRQKDQAILVEGYMDVILAHQNGFSNVIASMGTAVTEKQVDILKRLDRNVNLVLSLDADTAGEEAMLRCVDYENTLNTEIKVAVLPEGKDPDDVVRESPAKLQNLIDEAIPVLEYSINTDCSRVDISKSANKALIANKYLPKIKNIRDVTKQEHYLSHLSKSLKVDTKTLEAALHEIRLAEKPHKTVATEKPKDTKAFFTNSIEEQCLALLVQHPELRDTGAGLLPEYFQSSENREIFLAWQGYEDPASLRDSLDTSLWEYLDSLLKRPVLATQIEERYNRFVLRLREDYLKGLARKKATAAGMDTSAAEMPGEQDLEVSIELLEIFTQRAGKERKRRR